MRSMKEIEMIVACDEHGGIGNEGSLPWHIPEDLKRFREITDGAVVIMGRKTYEEIAKKFPDRTDLLPGREVFVVSKTLKPKPGITVVERMRYAVENLGPEKRIFVIGGERLFIEALSFTQRIFLTLVKGSYTTDRKIPLPFIMSRFSPVSHATGDNCMFLEMKRDG